MARGLALTVALSLLVSISPLPVIYAQESSSSGGEVSDSSQEEASESGDSDDVEADTAQSEGDEDDVTSEETIDEGEIDADDTSTATQKDGGVETEEEAASDEENGSITSSSSQESEGGGENGESGAEIASPIPDTATSSDETDDGADHNELNASSTASSTDGVVSSTSTQTGSATTSSDGGSISKSSSASSPESLTGSSTVAATTTGIATTSSASSTNTATVTGSSTATTTTGSSTIETGDAITSANVINVINTNIFNSFGLLLLLNALFGSGTFDLRDLNIDWFGGSGSTTQATCSLESCSDGDVEHTIISSSTAAIYNDVVVRSLTGGNAAYGPDGALISTGNAYAGANVVNVANSNFVDSSYLLISLNNFGDFSGDIVLPGKDFFGEFFSRLGQGIASFFGADNTAQINNEVSVEAATGSNSATSSEGAATVETGDAASGATVINSANTNMVGGGDSVFILLRVHGEWSGDIFGLPPGLAWAETPLGIQIYNTGEGGGGTSTSGTAFAGSNDASIFNNINVIALTGENRVEADTGEALVQTGDAQAGANVINVANTNVVGRNWILAVFNIFGNWSGNLSFGRPDLWVGAQIQTDESTFGPESELAYKFTITNNGDSDMTNTVLRAEYDSPYLRFKEGALEGEMAASWNLGTIKVGETIERVYHASIDAALPSGQTPILLTATVDGRESDANDDDNTEEIGILAQRSGGSGNDRPDSPGRAFLFVEKEAITENPVVLASTSVDYVITIRNNGRSPAYDAVLHDTLTDMSGDIVNEQSWDLGTILPQEEITVAYSVLYSASTTSGIYTNTAYVSATDNRSRDEGEGDANSDTATATVMVAGVLTSAACEPYLTAYLSVGSDNSSEEVRKLQAFLLERTESPSLEVSGVFDEATEMAVRSFQTLYRADILEPWGITEATGNVYFTTQKKINELACGNETEFELTARQQSEIEQFRDQVGSAQEGGEEVVIPANQDVGLTDGERVIGVQDEDGTQLLTEAAPVDAQLAAVAGAPLSTPTIIENWLNAVRGFFSSVPRVQASDLVPW